MTEKELFDIAGKIAESISGKSGEDEEKLLENWKNSSPGNKRLYKKIAGEKFKQQKRKEFQAYPLTEGWEAFLAKRKQSKQKRIYRILRSCAALVILALGLGYLFYPSFNDTSVRPVLSAFQPGSNRAQLTLNDGNTIDLTQYQGPLHLTEQRASIHNRNNCLTYENEKDTSFTAGKASPEISYNEISVPRCGEYQLKLSDGTIVFLNSMTKLRYPVTFSGDTREVSLTGEAYFQVAHDSLHPFIVHTSTHNVTVLGTQFNIKTFQDENEVSTTLAQGKIRIDGGLLNAPILLQPNEQFVYNKQQQQYKVKTVDVSYYIAWKDGHFRFRDVRLEEIMHTIERWYDVEVVYADPETKAYTFGLNFNRNETIDPILRIFQENGKIKITTKGKTLIITKGR